MVGARGVRHRSQGTGKDVGRAGASRRGHHLSVRAFGPQRLDATTGYYETIGGKLLIVGGDGRFADPEGSKAYAEEMNAAASKAACHRRQE